MKSQELREALQAWVAAERKAGRPVTPDRIGEYMRMMIMRQNNAPRADINGLSASQMYNLINDSFGPECIVKLNRLSEEEYFRIPLVRQALSLMMMLNDSEIKLTKNGWLPLKVVAELYRIGRPEYIIELLEVKRINEYDARAVAFVRALFEDLGWTKMRKGILSLTVKGRKAISDKEEAANQIIYSSLVGDTISTFTEIADEEPMNTGIAYIVWLLNKFGSEWRSDDFYQNELEKIFDVKDSFRLYLRRIFSQLFYWLGMVEEDRHRNKTLVDYYKKTDFVDMIFSFKQS